jgi:hypothetical protein
MTQTKRAAMKRAADEIARLIEKSLAELPPAERDRRLDEIHRIALAPAPLLAKQLQGSRKLGSPVFQPCLTKNRKKRAFVPAFKSPQHVCP